MNFAQLLDLSLDELTSRLGTVAAEIDEHGVRQLAELVETRAGDTYTKHEIPKLISRTLLQAGEPGVQALAAVLPRAPGAIYPDSILQALWFAAHGELPPTLLTRKEDLPPALNRPIPPNVREGAFRAIADLVQEATVSQEIFDRLVSFLYQSQFLGGPNAEDNGIRDKFRRTLFGLFTESSIKLSQRLEPVS